MKRSRDEGLLYVIRPLIVLVAAAVVALMTWTNVRERRTEIGLLRALGRDAPSIAKLFLGKALLVGLLGGLVGCSLGLLATAVVGWANQFNMALPGATAVLIATTLLGAPLVAAIASYLPTRVAVDQDPAVVLMER